MVVAMVNVLQINMVWITGAGWSLHQLGYSNYTSPKTI